MKKELKGVVIEALRDARFRVQFDHIAENGIAGSRVVICYISGKMRVYNINVLLGDQVLAVVEPDWSIGRIIKRF